MLKKIIIFISKMPLEWNIKHDFFILFQDKKLLIEGADRQEFKLRNFSLYDR